MKIIMLSAMYENGGNTTHRMLDGHPNLFVYDLVYNPTETRLLAEARRRGAQGLNGVDMLACQGAAAFKIWTGVEPPVEVMRNAVFEGLTQRIERSRE